ncbi:MAG: hypothetical protein HN348_30315 [Proteobacteria bacterium]|nr:hypothetical protein [Pseudomonadota bacterium]
MSTLRTPSNVERRTWSDEVFEPMEIKVHCTACNSQAKHVFSTAVYAPPRLRPKSSDSWDGFFTPTIFTCPNCGAQDAYRLTLRSTMAVAAAAISPQNEQVLVGLPGLWDGSIACRPTQAFAHLRTIAENSAGDGAAWRHLGNALERSGLLDDAIQSWHLAVQADDTEYEAAFSLADVFWRDDDTAALDLVAIALHRLGKHPPEDRCPDIVHWLLERLKELGSHSRELTLMLTWSEDQPDTTRPVINMSTIPVRRIIRWDVLEEMLNNRPLILAGFTNELDTGEHTMLRALVGEGVAPRLLGGNSPMNRAARRRAKRKTLGRPSTTQRLNSTI